MSDAQKRVEPVDLLAAFQNFSGKAIECISVLCIVPFAEGLVDDIISCDSNVSVYLQCTCSAHYITNVTFKSTGSFCRSSPGESDLGWC